MNHYILRLLLIAGSIALWFLTQRLISRRLPQQQGIYDHLHYLTRHLNDYLFSHHRAANVLLVISSFFIDALTLFVIALSIFGDSFTPFWGLLILFFLRQLSQMIVALPAPPQMIWRHPGVPSLFVTYGIGNDLFFSGHTALAVYGACQLATLQSPLLSACGIAIALFEAVTVIVLRAHWSLDVLTGTFAALCVALLIK